jgi:hypothetical protein
VTGGRLKGWGRDPQDSNNMKGETGGTTGKKNLSIATKAEPAGKPQKYAFGWTKQKTNRELKTVKEVKPP